MQNTSNIVENRAAKALTAAALCAASMGTASVTSGNITGAYNNANNYSWYISGLTDFDQVRSGLPGNGGMYCVPTATMNNLAYAASHGYPGIGPGDVSYADWFDGSPASPFYAAATVNLASMGLLMGTSTSGGTGPSGWWNGINAWLPDDQLDAGMFVANTAWSPRAVNIGQIAHNGGLTAFCYGRYNFSVLTGGGGTLTGRSGGHCVTTRRISTTNGTNTDLWYRDPGSNDDAFSQSVFQTSVVTTTDGVYTLPGNLPRVMSRMSLTTNDARVRLLDKIYTIFPKQGLTSDPSGSSFAINTLGGGFKPTHNNGPEVLFRAELNEAVLDLELSPMRSHVLSVVRRSVPGAVQTDVLILVDRSSGDSFTFGVEREMKESGEKGGSSLPGINAVWGPDGLIYATSDTERFVIQSNDGAHGDANGDGRVSAADYTVWRDTLDAFDPATGAPAPASDILYDDESQTVRILFPTIGEVKCYPSGTGAGDEPPTEEFSLNYEGVWSTQTQFAYDAKTGTTVFADNGSGELEGFVPCPNEIPGCQVAGNLAAPGGGTADIDSDGCGRFYITGADNIIRCYSIDENGRFVRNTDANFDGDTAGSFSISRSRTTYDPALHDGPEWGNIEISEVVGSDTVITDCLADFTTTGATLEGQPGYGVPDGGVDLDDLGFFLNNWIAGEEIADVTTTGATLEGQDGFGIADLSIDLDDLGFFLNAWLVGCP
ncbi:MAG: GC-type dockerin domain-anchored protein [Planctomycetota bacterium]